MNIQEVVLVGAGSHADDVITLINAINDYTKKTGFIRKVDCILDDNPKLYQKKVYGVKVLDKIDSLKNLDQGEQVNVVVSIGGSKARKEVVDKIDENDFGNINYLNLIHPSAQISKSVKYGKGFQALHGVVMSGNIRVGDHVQMSMGASSGHLSKIGDFVTVFPRGHLAHNEVGEGAEIGSMATLLPNVKIGKWARVGAGAVVTKDVKPNTTVVGSPARELKRSDKQL